MACILYEQNAKFVDVIRLGECEPFQVKLRVETEAAEARLPVRSRQTTLEERVSRKALQTDACCCSRQMGSAQETENEKPSGRSADCPEVGEHNSATAPRNHETGSKGSREIPKSEMTRVVGSVYRFYLQSFARVLCQFRIWMSPRPLNNKVMGRAIRDRNFKKIPL